MWIPTTTSLDRRMCRNPRSCCWPLTTACVPQRPHQSEKVSQASSADTFLTEVRFDFPLLLCEVLRHGLSCSPFEQWRFVDTLAVLQATTRYGCVKLQCLSLRVMAETGRAHRALDDCASLRQVMASVALALGDPMPSLLARFGQELDLPSSAAQLAILMDAGA